MKRLPFALVLLFACFGAPVVQAQPAPSYGTPINLEAAQKVLAAAVVAAVK